MIIIRYDVIFKKILGAGISSKEISKCVYLSLLIITKSFLKSESLLLFKINN